MHMLNTSWKSPEVSDAFLSSKAAFLLKNITTDLEYIKTSI